MHSVTSDLTLILIALTSADAGAQTTMASRRFLPEDLFRVQRVGEVEWSSDGHFAAIEISRPGRELGGTIPSGEITVVDTGARTLKTISPSAPQFLGFFSPKWAPNSRHLAFLSIDQQAIVSLWTWTPGAAARKIANLDIRASLFEAPFVWTDDDHLAAIVWNRGVHKSGEYYVRILHGPNVASQWRTSLNPALPRASVLESGIRRAEPPPVTLVDVNIRSGQQRPLAKGDIHRLSVSSDHSALLFTTRSTSAPDRPVASYFVAQSDTDAMYDAVNWGADYRAVSARSGDPIDPSAVAAAPPQKFASPPDSATRPRNDARILSRGPHDQATLQIANANDGSHLWVCGGFGYEPTACSETWKANEWIREIGTGRVEQFSYVSLKGQPLKGWILLPPDFVASRPVPAVTVVYPGTTYDASMPSAFSLYQDNFEHPQLLAALGYAVLLPSMPAPPDRADLHDVSQLTNGVLPAIDAAIACGWVDRERVVAMGQSAGGFATLGLVTQTNRFRSAIASASYGNLSSMYGTFYGQFRYGDAGHPLTAQVLRMLQMERGFFHLGAPPYDARERFDAGSPIRLVNRIETPVMLIHGELDFVPIQQAEEFFSALYRQDRRALLVRYQGEMHTITNRANVLDLWERLKQWLEETVTPDTR